MAENSPSPVNSIKSWRSTSVDTMQLGKACIYMYIIHTHMQTDLCITRPLQFLFIEFISACWRRRQTRQRRLDVANKANRDAPLYMYSIEEHFRASICIYSICLRYEGQRCRNEIVTDTSQPWLDRHCWSNCDVTSFKWFDEPALRKLNQTRGCHLSVPSIHSLINARYK